MVFVIAVIKERGLITRFRMIETDTKEVIELSYNNTKQLKVSNLKIVDDRLKGYGGSLDRYTTIYPNAFNIENKESLIILGIIRRESEDMYLCSDCNGNTREFTAGQLVNYKRNIERKLGIFSYSIANGKVVDNRIQAIEGSYSVLATLSRESEEKSKEIQDKINQYNAKAKLMGIRPMKFEVHDNIVKLVEAYGNHSIPPFVNIIGKRVYAGDATLEVINLPDNLIAIEEKAFMSCRELKKVNGGNIQKVDESAFNDCLKLESIKLDNAFLIGKDAFESCKSLVKINLRNAREIGSAAFFYCEELKYVGKLENIMNLVERAFCGCKSLETIEISGNMKNIQSATFYKCENLKRVRIVSNINKIYTDAFCECRSLEAIELPDSLTEIGDTAFNMCYSLKNISMPRNIKRIGVSAFSRCKSMEFINLSCNISRIEKGTFANTGIKELNIPVNIKSIDELAFYGSKLQQIRFNNTVELGDNVFSDCKLLAKVEMPMKMKRGYNKKAFNTKFKINAFSNLGIIGKILGI